MSENPPPHSHQPHAHDHGAGEDGALPACPATQARNDDGGHTLLGSSHGRNQRRMQAVTALTLATMVVEILAGWWSGSMALLADGWHMASHAVALGAAAFAYGYAARHANDRRYSFGTGKVGDLTAFGSSLLLGVVAIAMVYESTRRLLQPGAVAYGEALWVAVLGLVVNLASAWLLHGDDSAGGHGHDHAAGHAHEHAHDHDHDHEHKDEDGTHRADHNLRAAYLHVVADALTSVLAIAALLAGAYLGWAWLDPVVGLLGAFIIGRWALGLSRQTAAVLLDASVDPGLVQQMRRALEAGGDTHIDDLHLWRLAPGKFSLIVSLHSAQPQAPAAYKARLRSFGELVHVTVEVERSA